MVHILKQEGLRGFYKGVASPAVSCAFVTSVLFVSYSNCFSYLEEKTSLRPNTLHFWAGFFAGIPCTILNCPTELVKCKAQVNINSKGLLSEEYAIFLVLLKSRNLFRGQMITVVRDLPSYGVYFYSYEVFNSYYNNCFIAGGFAGMATWGVTYPFDVLKTVWQTNQTQQLSYYSTFRHCFNNQGSRFFFKGLGATLFRAWPHNAVVFFVYNSIMNL